jgi:hypothetical protein
MSHPAPAAADPHGTGPVVPATPASVSEVRTEQQRCDHEPCFRTDKRYNCRETGCEWRSECRKLVATWLR